MSRFRLAAGLATIVYATFECATAPAFFDWKFAEFFSNFDGSIQFIELKSFGASETSATGAEIRSLATGKVITLSPNLSGSTLNKSFLLATAGFGSLPGAVPPDFPTRPLPANFFNPAGDTITLFHHGVIDSRAISAVPTDGVTSRVYPSNTLETNSPTNFADQTGAVDLFLLPGDYNNNGTVDAADYVLWRKYNNTATTLPNDSTPGTDQTDYTVWRSHFGQPAGSGASAHATAAVPEPSTLVLLIIAAAGGYIRRRW